MCLRRKGDSMKDTVVQSLPLSEVWDASGHISEERVRELSAPDIAALLRGVWCPTWASLWGGSHMRQRFEFWKVEGQPHLVAPEAGHKVFVWRTCRGSLDILRPNGEGHRGGSCCSACFINQPPWAGFLKPSLRHLRDSRGGWRDGRGPRGPRHPLHLDSPAEEAAFMQQHGLTERPKVVHHGNFANFIEQAFKHGT